MSTGVSIGLFPEILAPTSRPPIAIVPRTGGPFSKAPETFRARKATAKSRTLRVQSCFSRIF